MEIKKFLSGINQRIIKKKCATDMMQFKNTRQGRCFIIGNGPSLRIEDLEAISNETTFASNRIYGIFQKTKWRPTYYVSQDFNVLEEIKDDLYDVSMNCHQMILCGNILRSFPHELKKKENVHFVYISNTSEGRNKFDIDVPDGIHNGINVTCTMIELALFMGFSEIYLIGVDNSYALKKNEKGETIVDNNSPNSYFAGIAPLKYETVMQMPQNTQLDAATCAYLNINRYLNDKPQKVYNATRGGKLEAFTRVNLDKIIQKL